MNAAPAELLNTIPPDELAVLDWARLRLADLHERQGISALTVTAHYYPHSGEIDAQWVLHAGGECVIDNRSIADGVKALRAKLAESQATEARP